MMNRIYSVLLLFNTLSMKTNIYMPVKGVYYEVAFINHLGLYSFIVQSAPCGLTNVGEQVEHIYSSH